MTRNEMFCSVFATIMNDLRAALAVSDAPDRIGFAGNACADICAQKAREIVSEYYIEETKQEPTEV